MYAGSRKAALAELDTVQDRVAKGQPPRDASRTLADWLRHWRETTLAASDRKASTKELYANLARNHLEPEPFGAVRLLIHRRDQLVPYPAMWRGTVGAGGEAVDVARGPVQSTPPR